MNATYLQGHLVRKHPEHVSYIGDAVAHTKLVTQKLESQLVTVEDKIELEKHRNEELMKKNDAIQKQTQLELAEKQAEIQTAERSRYESKLKLLEESFTREVTQLKASETHYQTKIADLECKTNYTEKKNSTIGNIVTEMQTEKSDYENQFTARLSSMETQMREQQQRAEDAAVTKATYKAPKRPKKMHPVIATDGRPKKAPKRAEEPSESDRRDRLSQLALQFRPAIEALFRGEMDKLGIAQDKPGLTDGMYKIKMEELRNNRSQKVGSRPQFYDHRLKIEDELNRRSQTDLSGTSFYYLSINLISIILVSTAPPARRPVRTGKKKAPIRPSNQPSPIKKVPANTALVQLRKPDRPQTPPQKHKPTWSNVPELSPGKPGFASTLKPSNPPIESSVESSGWEAIEKHDDSTQPKLMRTYKDTVVESVDVETITEKTEPATENSSNWDSEDTLKDEVSIGHDIKSRTRKKNIYDTKNRPISLRG